MDATTPVSTQPRKSMDTPTLKKFAQEARRVLREQVSAKLAQVLADNSAARREAPKAVQQLEGEVGRTSRDQVVERVAYTWFNRFTALRFMDANGYTAVRVVTPADGQTRPEILSEATAGVIGNEIPQGVSAQVRALLDNRTPSQDPQGEAYRLLLVATCNHWHAAMPFMFETISDYTELLMPEDLLSQGSILAKLRTVMTEDACQDVEIIGWLYQFYISEKKDEVFAGLKKNRKITPENIPAATQLFTPHWIVRYLVENSIGRLWMLNRPNSRLKEQMDYYIAPEDPEADFLCVSSPEEIKVCDPACGSGHMLTYAFDLLHAIYEEEGYDAAEIPGLILSQNLYGIEIDERAGALAAFALTMKAAARRKRFLRRGVQPNICVLEPVRIRPGELDDYMDAMGSDLFTASVCQTLTQFEEADNFGSLVRPALDEVTKVRQIIDNSDVGGTLFLRDFHARVKNILRMSDYLAPKYHVVIANPPYMGGKGMNDRLSNWARSNYPDSKSDLYAMFIERSLTLGRPSASIAMVTIQNWMFLSSFEKLRENILRKSAISLLVQIGYNSFPELNSKVVQAAAFVIKNTRSDLHGQFVNVNDAPQAANKEREFLERINSGKIHSVRDTEFLKIPGSPIAYWLTDQFREAFAAGVLLQEYAIPRQGFATGNNDRFLRFWHEVPLSNFKRDARNAAEANESGQRWFPCNKGGEFRKWYGNNSIVGNWQYDGKEMKEYAGSVIRNPQYYFREGMTWSTLTSSSLSMRFSPAGYIFETKGSVCFALEENPIQFALALMNTRVVEKALLAISPTLDFHEGPIGRVPVIEVSVPRVCEIADAAISCAKSDWDGSETSWDFSGFPLLSRDFRRATLSETYAELRSHWQAMTKGMQQLEEENNRIFIDAYGLRSELNPEVSLEEITLTCNPAYRYGGKRGEAELEALLLADTMREFVSYAVGCMFGRYSLDAPGLILANQGEQLVDYLANVELPSFEPDADNVIPVLDGDWFADDIAARFRKFLRVTFGSETLQENLTFIEEALGKDIRSYFTRDFFSDHVKRYKKRPIYWLFSSPKGTFNALIYMHRYRPDTVSVLLNDYLREFRSKLEAYRRAQEALSISGDASPSQKTKALKEIEATGKQIEELDAWERDVLFPLATQKIEIDLDDGVKANYPKFGAALKAIKGLNDAED